MSTTQPDEYSNLMQAIPMWGWVLGLGMLAILALSIVANFVLPSKSGVRLLWTIMQFLVGISIFGVAHVTAFLYATVKNSSLSPFDFVMKPVEVWKPTIATLPNNARRIWLLGWG